MGNTGYENKSRFLGMPAGTARNKLVKMIMYDMAVGLKRDICYRCGNRIESFNDFSIDHKIPWQGNSVDLFWDLDNISFSHGGCNASSGRRVNKIESPAGMQWCTKCKTNKPLSEFTKNSNGGRYGRQDYCKLCRSVYKK